MSQFYREQKEIIFKHYKKYGKKSRVLQYIFLILVLVTLIGAILRIISSGTFFDPVLWSILIVVFIFIAIYKVITEKYINIRNEAVIEYAESDISDENLKKLMNEIEDNVSSVNDLGKWISGSFITMLVLILTLTSNIILKFFDFIIANDGGSDKKKLVSELHQLNIQSLAHEIILELSSVLFITILIGYFTVITCTRNKREVSAFLKDVLYERQKNEKS